LLVPERDIQGITHRILEYAEKPVLLSEHGRLLRERISGKFDVRRCASALCDIYDEL